MRIVNLNITESNDSYDLITINYYFILRLLIVYDTYKALLHLNINLQSLNIKKTIVNTIIDYNI